MGEKNRVVATEQYRGDELSSLIDGGGGYILSNGKQ
jgi:hypothetical protein